MGTLSAMTSEISPTRMAFLSVLAAMAIAMLGCGSTAYAKTCTSPNVPKYPSSKGGYFLRLEVTKISCPTGKSLMLSHYRCRAKKGIRGRCDRVRGYRCTEKRKEEIQTEFNSKVTCTNAGKRFAYNYQQIL